MEYIDSVLYETNEIPFNKTFCTVIVFVVFDCSIGYDVVLFSAVIISLISLLLYLISISVISLSLSLKKNCVSVI